MTTRVSRSADSLRMRETNSKPSMSGIIRSVTTSETGRPSAQVVFKVASASRALPSGGDSAGALIGLLVVVILVILILKLMNREVIVR